MLNVKNKQRIFFDFDGTLIDNKERYFALYKIAKAEFDLNVFSEDEYWHHKTSRLSEKGIILKNNIKSPAVDKYLSFRLNNIEAKEYLKLDRLIVDKKLLEDASKHNFLYLVTMRRNYANLLWQLNEAGILNYFKQTICRGNFSGKVSGLSDETEQKKNLLESFKPFCDNDVMIGDTILDYSIAKHFGLKRILVYSGICKKNELLSNIDNQRALYKNVNEVLCNLKTKKS